MRKNALKTLCLLLVLCLAVSITITPAANAEGATISIVGSLIITVAVIVTVIIIASGSTGLNENIARAAADQNTSPENIVEGLFRTHYTIRGMQLTQLLMLFKDGLKYSTATGALLYNSALSAYLTDFFDWAYSADGGNLRQYDDISNNAFVDTTIIQNNGTVDVSMFDTISIGINSNNVIGNMTYEISQYTSDVYTCNVRVNNGTRKRFISVFASLNPFVLISNGRSIQSEYMSDIGINYCRYGVQIGTSNIETSSPPLTVIESTENNGPIIKAACYCMLYGEVFGDVNVDTGAFDLPSNKDTNVQEPSQGMTLGQDVIGATVDIDMYLDALKTAILTGTAELEGELDGQTVTGEMELDGPITLVQETTAAIGGEGTQVGTETGSGTIDDFSIPLYNFFPFCLPWDAYDILQLFKGTPEAPSVTWVIDIPRIVETEIEIDLSVFDPVASVLRNMELVAFVFFLAWESKKILYGS